MRQVGILAAAGLYALDHNITRLSDDHANARVLADGLRKLAPFRPNDPATNIVVVDIVQGRLAGWLAELEQQGVLGVAFGPQRMRLVTHINITREDVDEALARIASIAGAVSV